MDNNVELILCRQRYRANITAETWCHGCLKERTRVQHGEHTVSFNDPNDADKTINNTKTNREAQRLWALNKVNLPQRKEGTRAT